MVLPSAGRGNLTTIVAPHLCVGPPILVRASFLYSLCTFYSQPTSICWSDDADAIAQGTAIIQHASLCLLIVGCHVILPYLDPRYNSQRLTLGLPPCPRPTTLPTCSCPLQWSLLPSRAPSPGAFPPIRARGLHGALQQLHLGHFELPNINAKAQI